MKATLRHRMRSKRPSGASETQVLKHETHAFAVLLPHAEEAAALLEALTEQGFRVASRRLPLE